MNPRKTAYLTSMELYNSDSRSSIENKKLINLALLLLLALGLVWIVSLYMSQGRRSNDEGVLVKKESVQPFERVSLIARSAIVLDVNKNKILFAKNPDDVLPLASLTKVLTAVTAVELLPKNTTVTIRKEFLDTEGDSGLRSDEQWKLSDLIDYSLMVSSNDGAHAIAAVAGAFQMKEEPSQITKDNFIRKMNDLARTIGMKSSHFSNESGLDLSKSESGGYGSARDITTLFSYTFKNHPEILAATKYLNLSFTSLSNIRHNAENTDIALSSIPAVLGSKTGYTELAGGNLAITFDPSIGEPVTIVVLGSTIDGRFSDVQTLVKMTMEYINNGS